MAKLPFVVQPRLKPIIEVVGSEISGQLEIERRGFLTVAEKSMCQSMQDNNDGLQQMQLCARKIAAGLGIELATALEMLGEVLQGQTVEELEPFMEDVNEAAMHLLNSVERQNMARAISLIVSRIDPDFGVEDLNELHPDLIEGLAKLYADEEAKSVEALEAAAKKRPSAKRDKQEAEEGEEAGK